MRILSGSNSIVITFQNLVKHHMTSLTSSTFLVAHEDASVGWLCIDNMALLEATKSIFKKGAAWSFLL